MKELKNLSQNDLREISSLLHRMNYLLTADFVHVTDKTSDLEKLSAEVLRMLNEADNEMDDRLINEDI